MIVKIWNKIDDINGVNPEIILKQKPEFREDVVILICKDNVVIEMQSCSVLKDVYGMAKNLTPNEVGYEYLSIKKDVKDNNMNDIYYDMKRILLSLINN